MDSGAGRALAVSRKPKELGLINGFNVLRLEVPNGELGTTLVST